MSLFRLGISVCLFLTTGILPLSAQAEELRFGRWDEFCPYTCNFEKRDQHGYVLDIFMAVAKSNSMDFRSVKVPDARKYWALDENISNVVTVWGSGPKSQERAILAKEAIAVARGGVVARKGTSYQIKTTADLTSLNLLAVAAVDYPPVLMKYLEQNKGSKKITTLSGNELGPRSFEMIARKRADVRFSSLDRLTFLVRTAGFSDKLGVSPAPFYTTTLIYSGFSKNNPNAQKLADMMTKGIRELRQSGRLAKILSAYGLPDWAEQQ